MSCSPCWGPCERTLWKDHSPHTHRQGAAPRCPLYTRHDTRHYTKPAPELAKRARLSRGLDAITPAHPDCPLHLPALDAPRRVLLPLLSVDLMSGHGALRLGVHVLFGVWKDQLIWFSQVLDVTEGG